MTGWKWFWTLVGFLVYIIVLIFLFFYQPFETLFTRVITGISYGNIIFWAAVITGIVRFGIYGDFTRRGGDAASGADFLRLPAGTRVWVGCRIRTPAAVDFGFTGFDGNFLCDFLVFEDHSPGADCLIPRPAGQGISSGPHPANAPTPSSVLLPPGVTRRNPRGCPGRRVRCGFPPCARQGQCTARRKGPF